MPSYLEKRGKKIDLFVRIYCILVGTINHRNLIPILKFSCLWISEAMKINSTVEYMHRIEFTSMDQHASIMNIVSMCNLSSIYYHRRYNLLHLFSQHYWMCNYIRFVYVGTPTNAPI